LSPLDYDVVVVGARCAGAATAMLLARGGLRVLAVDQARYGSDTLSTHALTRPGVLQLSRWGVLDELRTAGTPVVNRVVYHYPDEVADVPVRPRGDVDGLYAPRRHLLDRILVDAAVRAGAEVRHRTRVQDLYIQDGRVAGVVLDRTPVRARLVIGADGARSTVARRVGAELRYAAPHSTATVYTYVAGLPADAYRNWFGAGVGAALVPTNDGLANVCVTVPTAWLPRRRTDPARWFAARLAGAAPELAAAVVGYGDRRYPTFVGRPGFTRRSWGPGWALVGDAAYFADPVSAHGMTDALIGAELLARAVLATAGGEPEPAALAGYAREWRRLAGPMIPAVARVASLAGDPAGLRQAHRAMSAAMRAEWDYLTGLSSQVEATRLG
jgi:flavin-dependent dehydrogenase